GRGARARHRRGPRAGGGNREVERDPRGPGSAERVHRSGRGGHHDRRTAHAKRHRAGHHGPGRGLRDDRQGQHADAVPAAEEAALGAHPRRLFREHGPRPPGPPHDQGRPGAGLDRVRRRRPGRAAAPHGHEKGKKTVEVVYLITSDSDVGPAALAAWVRGHWEIENKLHWVRDVAYQEDKPLVRTWNAPRVMAILCSLAISLLRLD